MKQKAFFIVFEGLSFGKISKNTKSEKNTSFNPFLHTVSKWSRILKHQMFNYVCPICNSIHEKVIIVNVLWSYWLI